jgi:beta-glucuronidase
MRRADAAEAILDPMQMVEQEIAAARALREQALDLGPGRGIDLPPLRDRPCRRTSSTRIANLQDPTPFYSVPSTGCAWKIGGPLTGAQTNKPPADRPARRPGWLGRAFDLYFRGGWSEAMAAEGDTSYRDAFRDPLIGHETLVAIAGRRLEPLGPWRLTLDMFEEGLRQNWPALDEKPPAGWTLPRDYDLAGGTPVEVPSCWNLNRPEWRHFEGTGWYATHFEARPERPGERTFLRIGAANYETRVFLNGRFLGRHLGGSTPFCVELTQALVPGTNRLQIAVDNRRKADRVPPVHFDWFNYGGLYREVELLRLPPVFIREASVTLVPDGSLFTLRADVALSDKVSGVAEVWIPELCIALEVPVRDGIGMAIIAASPALWSPSRPKLYLVETRFGDDTVSDQIGFREIRVDNRDILLNGKPIYLRGICVHEDDVNLGKASTDEDVRRCFADARELGCNFLRLAHYPHHERVARIADELGFLLWAEIPVYWMVDFANRDTYRDAENQLRELISRDRNRASVILWSVGNETPQNADRLRFLSDLAEVARGMDSTRLITTAGYFDGSGKIADPLDPFLDVIGINEYFGWYEVGFSGLERALSRSEPGKPVIISETGADALAGRRGPPHELASEDKQADLYRQQFEILSRHSIVRGTAPWILYDFRSERRQSSVQRGFNRKGLIAEDKATRKRAFFVLAEIYRALRDRHG